MTKYKFEVRLKDRKLYYESTSYQTLLEHVYNDKKKDFEMYDILSIELVRTYIYEKDDKKFLAYVNDTLYRKLSNEYDLRLFGNFATLDDYIRFRLAHV